MKTLRQFTNKQFESTDISVYTVRSENTSGSGGTLKTLSQTLNLHTHGKQPNI